VARNWTHEERDELRNKIKRMASALKAVREAWRATQDSTAYEYLRRHHLSDPCCDCGVRALVTALESL
jgi:hypothetical protein